MVKLIDSGVFVDKKDIIGVIVFYVLVLVVCIEGM